jgi:hypothetical protein
MIISFTGKEAARGKIKKPPGGGSVPSFSRFIRAYRFPDGMALAPLRKLKGCRAGDRANSLTATLDSKYFYYRYYVYSSFRVEYCQRTRSRSFKDGLLSANHIH